MPKRYPHNLTVREMRLLIGGIHHERASCDPERYQYIVMLEHLEKKWRLLLSKDLRTRAQEK